MCCERREIRDNFGAVETAKMSGNTKDRNYMRHPCTQNRTEDIKLT